MIVIQRKHMKIIVIIIVIFVVLYMLYNFGERHSKNENPNENNISEYDQLVEEDNKRLESTIEYDARQSDVKVLPVDDGDNENYSGVENIFENREQFIKCFDNVNSGIAIANNLYDFIRYSNTVISTCNDNNITEYYSSNKETIKLIFNLSTIDEFENLFKSIKDMKKIYIYTVDLDSLHIESETECEFDMKLSSKDSTNVAYIHIKAMITSMENLKVNLKYEEAEV